MLTRETLKVGGRYNWRNQPERLVYIGMCEPRNGRWHQFEKVDEPGVVWCEVLSADLHMLEETQDARGVQPSKERILQLAVEHLDCYVKDDDGNVFNGLPEDIGMTARVTAFAEAILKECCSARRADGVAVNPGASGEGQKR